jgi:Cu2+-exporting ATPase
MYLSMGHIMWGFPLPVFLKSNPIFIGILQMLLALIVMGINYKFWHPPTQGTLHFPSQSVISEWN